jgi:Flp pilus assembly protein TadB
MTALISALCAFVAGVLIAHWCMESDYDRRARRASEDRERAYLYARAADADRARIAAARREDPNP